MTKNRVLKLVGTSLCFFEDEKFIASIDLYDTFNSKVQAIYYFPESSVVILRASGCYVILVDARTRAFNIQFRYRLPYDLVVVGCRESYIKDKDVKIFEIDLKGKSYYLCGYYDDQFGLIEIKKNKYAFVPLPFQPKEELNTVYIGKNRFVCFYDKWKKMLVYDGENVFDYENGASIKDIKGINVKRVKDYVRGKKDFLVLQSDDLSQVFVFNKGQSFALSYDEVDLSYFLKNVLGSNKNLEYFDCVVKEEMESRLCSFYAIVRDVGTDDIKAYKMELLVGKRQDGLFSLDIFEKCFPEDARQEFFFRTAEELKDYVLFKAGQINSALLHCRNNVLFLTQDRVYNNCVEIYKRDFKAGEDTFYLAIEDKKLTLLQRSNGNLREIQSFKVDKDKLTIDGSACYFVKNDSTVYFFDRFSVQPRFRKLDLRDLGLDFSVQALRFFDVCRVKDLYVTHAVFEVNDVYYSYNVLSLKALAKVLYSQKIKQREEERTYRFYVVEVPLDRYAVYDEASASLLSIHSDGNFSKVAPFDTDLFKTFQNMLLFPRVLHTFSLSRFGSQYKFDIIHAKIHPVSWKKFYNLVKVTKELVTGMFKSLSTYKPSTERLRI